MNHLAELRAEYADHGLEVSDLDADPVVSFAVWLEQAIEAGLHEPNAMVLSTVSAGQPSSRMVLLKEVAGRGFVFYTNLSSRKGLELSANPLCSLLFPWHPLERQVRVEGTASLLPRSEVAAYFATRPRGSQLGAHASHQSSPVPDRAALTSAYTSVEQQFAGIDVPPPGEWGGFLVVPNVVEFWQGRPGRMHDRLVYTREASGWTVGRLAP